MTPEYCASLFRLSNRYLDRSAGLRDFSGFESFVVAKTRRNDSMAWTEITRRKYQRDGLCYAGLFNALYD
jgi:hypothetical protein